MNKRRMQAFPGRSRGFTMIEVLIAVLILAIGLLGVAGVQLLSMQQTSNANVRSQVTLYAQDIAERIRANGGAALDAGVVDDIEALLLRDLGPESEVDIDIADGVAEIEITWEERDPTAAEKVTSQTFTMRARL